VYILLGKPPPPPPSYTPTLTFPSNAR